jgi:hypothetical protein
MQRELGFVRKIANNKSKTENSITTTTALALTVATVLLLLSSPVLVSQAYGMTVLTMQQLLHLLPVMPTHTSHMRKLPPSLVRLVMTT